MTCGHGPTKHSLSMTILPTSLTRGVTMSISINAGKERQPV